MPSVSKAQRRAAGIAKAIQEGEIEAVPGTASAAMAEMDPESLEHFASTPEKDLPNHKKTRRFGARRAHRKPPGVRRG